jgi:ABC-type sugar transport system permease subunit
VAGCLLLGLVLAVTFALALNHAGRTTRVLRGLTFMPYIVSSIGAAVLFRLVFNGDFGVPSMVLTSIGLDPVSMLGDPKLAMVSIIIAQVWTDLPLAVLIILGGLQSVDTNVMDAAHVDGASLWRRIFHVQIPHVVPQLFLSAVFLSYGSLTGLGIILGLTGGGPGNSTETLSMSLYRVAFRELDRGQALALVTVVLVLNGLLTLTYLLFAREKES